MNRPRVLVVEDRPSVLKLMATILERGHDVSVASDGPSALSLLASETFDVVLTDVRIPGATGFDVLKTVKGSAPETRVVMITAYANVVDAVAAIKLGAYDYVAKPVDADEISLVVARAVAHAQDTPGAAEDTGPDKRSLSAAAGSGDVSVGFHRMVEMARDAASRRYLVGLMRLFHGNVTQAAKRAGMTRESLHRVLKKYAVRSEDHREKDVGASHGGTQPGGTVLHAVE